MPTAQKCVNDNTKDCPHGVMSKYVLPPIVRDVLIGALTIGIVATIATIIRMDKSVSVLIESTASRKLALERAVSELQSESRESRTAIANVGNAFSRFESAAATSFYTVTQAHRDHRSQAAELQKVWDAIHAVQLDVARVHRGMNGGSPRREN